MIGHNQIISTRKKGKLPKGIFIDYGITPKKPKRFWEEHEKQIELGFFPFVYVDENELPDLRFCYGVFVHCYANDWTDDYTIFLDHLVKFKPQKIIATASDCAVLMEFETEWKTYACTD